MTTSNFLYYTSAIIILIIGFAEIVLYIAACLLLIPHAHKPDRAKLRWIQWHSGG